MPGSALPSPEHEGSMRSGNLSQSAAVATHQATQPTQQQQHQQQQPRVKKESPVTESSDSQTLKLPSIHELIGNDMGPPYYHQQPSQQPPPPPQSADQQPPHNAHPYPQSSQNQPPPNYAPASASPTGSAAALAPPNGYVASNSRSIDPNLQTPTSAPPQNGPPYTPNSGMAPPPPMMPGPYAPYPSHHVYPSPSGQHAVPVWPGQYHPDPRRNPDSPLMHHPGEDDNDLWRHQQGPLPYTMNYAPVSPAGSNSTERYACATCNKSFSRPSSLRIHNHSHTGEKPFICGVKGCGKAFSVRSNMKRHERGCHPTPA